MRGPHTKSAEARSSSRSSSRSSTPRVTPRRSGTPRSGTTTKTSASNGACRPSSSSSSSSGLSGRPVKRVPTPKRMAFGGRQAQALAEGEATQLGQRLHGAGAPPPLTFDAVALSEPTALPAPPTPNAAASLGVGVTTFRALRELEQREIEPEDYDLLSRLHASSGSASTLSAREVETACPPFVLRADHAADCVVCMAAMRKGERVRRLPCSGRHVFHDGCIVTWLTRSSTCCPADREDVRR
eukprot:1194133-Prymnesium_polylepis.1